MHCSLSATLTAGKLHGHGLAALAYKIKTHENLFCRGFWSDTRKFAPTKISHYTVYPSLHFLFYLSLVKL